MEGFAHDELFPQNPVHADDEPDPGRMLVKIILKNACDVSHRLKIAVEFLEPHLLEAMLQETLPQRRGQFEANVAGNIHKMFCKKSGDFSRLTEPEVGGVGFNH